MVIELRYIQLMYIQSYERVVSPDVGARVFLRNANIFKKKINTCARLDE